MTAVKPMNILNGSIVIASRFAENLPLGTLTEEFDGVVPDITTHTFTPGTGAGQFDRHWESGLVTLAAGATVTYTLSALTDQLGRSVPLVRVREWVIAVKNKTNAEDHITVGGAATNPWTAYTSGTFVVYDVDAKVFTNPLGLVVAAGSNDQLLITNTGTGSVDIQVAFKGCSA